MNKSKLSSLFGFIAFSGQAIVAAAAPEFMQITTGISILISFGFGYIRAPASHFFKGMIVAMACWSLWAIATGSPYGRVMAIIMIPLVLLWKLGIAALSFYFGKLVNAGIEKLLGRLIEKIGK